MTTTIPMKCTCCGATASTKMLGRFPICAHHHEALIGLCSGLDGFQLDLAWRLIASAHVAARPADFPGLIETVAGRMAYELSEERLSR